MPITPKSITPLPPDPNRGHRPNHVGGVGAVSVRIRPDLTVTVATSGTLCRGPDGHGCVPGRQPERGPDHRRSGRGARPWCDRWWCEVSRALRLARISWTVDPFRVWLGLFFGQLALEAVVLADVAGALGRRVASGVFAPEVAAMPAGGAVVVFGAGLRACGADLGLGRAVQIVHLGVVLMDAGLLLFPRSLDFGVVLIHLGFVRRAMSSGESSMCPFGRVDRRRGRGNGQEQGEEDNAGHGVASVDVAPLYCSASRSRGRLWAGG